MRPTDGALPTDRFIAFLAEVFEELVVEGAVFILLVHWFELFNNKGWWIYKKSIKLILNINLCQWNKKPPATLSNTSSVPRRATRAKRSILSASIPNATNRHSYVPYAHLNIEATPTSPSKSTLMSCTTDTGKEPTSKNRILTSCKKENCCYCIIWGFVLKGYRKNSWS